MPDVNAVLDKDPFSAELSESEVEAFVDKPSDAPPADANTPPNSVDTQPKAEVTVQDKEVVVAKEEPKLDEKPVLEETPEQEEENKALSASIETLNKRINDLVGLNANKGRIASEAERKAKDLETQLASVKSADELAEQLISTRPELKDNIIALLRGEKPSVKVESTDKNGGVSDELLDKLLDDFPENKPLVDELRESRKGNKVLLEMFNKLQDKVKHIESRSQADDETRQQREQKRIAGEIMDRRFKNYNALHKAYPNLALPKDIDAEMFNQMVLDGKIPAERDGNGNIVKIMDPYWSKVFERAKLVDQVVLFAEKGPYGTGTPEKPYYPDVEIAYEVLLRQSGKLQSVKARERIEGRREAVSTLSSSKKPSIRDIPGHDKVPVADPKTKEEIEAKLNSIIEIEETIGELTEEQTKEYETLLERLQKIS